MENLEELLYNYDNEEWEYLSRIGFYNFMFDHRSITQISMKDFLWLLKSVSNLETLFAEVFDELCDLI